MSGLVERLLKQAQSASLASKMTARAKSLRQGHKPPRDDLYAWATPEQTLEAQAAARITALEAENERMKAALGVEWCAAEADARWANDSDLERCIARRERIAQALGDPHDAD